MALNLQLRRACFSVQTVHLLRTPPIMARLTKLAFLLLMVLFADHLFTPSHSGSIFGRVSYYEYEHVTFIYLGKKPLFIFIYQFSIFDNRPQPMPKFFLLLTQFLIFRDCVHLKKKETSPTNQRTRPTCHPAMKE